MGGGATKVQLQFVNSAQPQSERACMLLGMYSATDKYEHVKEVFAGAFAQLHAVVSSFTLELTSDKLPVLALPAHVEPHRNGACRGCFPDGDGVDSAQQR